MKRDMQALPIAVTTNTLPVRNKKPVVHNDIDIKPFGQMDDSSHFLAPAVIPARIQLQTIKIKHAKSVCTTTA
jgi:hypothetical protein